MELRHLRYFLAVATERNFTRAAEQLGIGQPPLSQQIKSLEGELGVDLFRRKPHGAELTPAGAAFLVEAKRVLDLAQRATLAAQRAGRGQVGHMRLGFTGSAAFNPIVSTLIRRFSHKYPDVELALEEANTPTLLQGILGDRLDAAFLRPGSKGLDGVVLHRFPDEAMKIVLPSAHPLASRRRLPLSALTNDSFVLVPGAAGFTLRDEIIRACERAGFTPKLAQPAPQVSSVVNLVAAGLGVSVVPTSMTQVRVRGVRYLGIEAPKMHARLALAWRPSGESVVLDNFIAML